jgi:DNA-binding transcriptional MerR regulator
MMEAFYSEAISINQSQWSEADTDLRFYLNDQTIWNDYYGNLPANRRRQFNFNKIRRVVDMISGHQRRNRKSIIAIPIENGDEITADQFTKVLMHICRQEGVLETISETFQNALITGMNLLEVWLDYRQDPVSGSIKVNNCNYNDFLVDPYFRKLDLSDCRGLWRRKFLSKRECISLLPDHAQEILGLIGNDYGNGRDGKFQFQTEAYNYGLKDLLTYDTFYHRTYRTQKILVDSETGEKIEWKSQDEDKLKLFLKTYPQVTRSECEIPSHNVAIVVQGKVMYDGPNPMGIDQYPFVPVVAYYHPESPYFPFRVQGVVRSIRDAQYLYNRRKVIELDILESQINSGYIYKENALVNPKDIYLSGQGKGLALKEEANMTDVIQIQSPRIDPSMIQLSEILGKEINEIAGVTEEMLGFDNADTKSGYHSMLKQSAGVTTLQGLFDNLDYSTKLLGKMLIDLIQANYMPGKIQQILENQQPAAQFYNKAFGIYHAAVEEGYNTTTQKQMQFAQLLHLKEIGVPIPDEELLEASTLQNKPQLIEAIKKNQQQAQQLQQQQAQLQMQEMQSKIELANARAQADQGLGIERISRVEENRALAQERRAQAAKDEDIALLNLIKALKEIDDVDINQIQKLLSISKALQPERAEMPINNTQQPQNGSEARI